MIVSAWNTSATTHNTAWAISDSSVGGASWNLIRQVVTGLGVFIMAAWWKIANTNDQNGSTGISITTTASGGTGTQSSRSECDVVRVASGLKVIGIEGAALGTNTASVTTLQAFGTMTYEAPDPFLWSALGMSLSNGGLISAAVTNPTPSTGVLSPTSLGSPLLLANATGLGATLGVASVPGTVTYQDNWTTARTNSSLIGATFLYTSKSGLLLPLLENV